MNLFNPTLLYEKDGKIPAKVSSEIGLYDHFEFNMHEGHWKIITGFVVELTPPPLLFSENDHTIIFTADTDLHAASGIHQDHYMKFKDYTDIKNGVYNSHYPIGKSINCHDVPVHLTCFIEF